MSRFRLVVPVLLSVLCLSTAARAQQLIWETVVDPSGGYDLIRAITLTRHAVVVVGNASNSAEGIDDFVVQSLRRANGAVRWTDHVPEAPSILTGVQVASAQGRLFASGYSSGAPAETDIVVRGYEAATGRLLWNSVWDTGRDDTPQAIAANAAVVVVVGYGADATPGHAVNFIVRAYDASNGTVLWEDHVDRPDLESEAWTVAITGNRVYVAGNTVLGDRRDLLVRAYNASSGTLAWEMTRASTSPTSVKAAGGRVFVAGVSSTHSYIGAFDAKRGGLLWEDEGTDSSGNFRDLAVQGQRIAAVGFSQSTVLLRAYDVESGILEWDARQAAPDHVKGSGMTVALNDRAVYIGGQVGSFFVSNLFVRGFDAEHGTLLWEDFSTNTTGSANAVDMVLGKNRLFVAAQVVNATQDFSIRAYDIRLD